MSPQSATARVGYSAPVERLPSPVLLGSPPRRGWPLLRACRPRQWLKNAVVVVAPASAGALRHPGALPALLGAFAAFCLMSSATYLINDVRDRDSDRRHPRKRLRPVAAGEISVAGALRAAAALALAAVTVAALVTSMLVVVVLGYAALTLSYTLLWRDVVVMDVLVIAAGFVFRALAGAAAVDIALSRSFLIVTSACALFLVVGKRHAELVNAGRRMASRTTLRGYSRRGLRLLLLASAGVGCVAYAAWSFNRPASGPWLALSLAPFVLWLARYVGLVRQGAGEAPEELVLRDRGLMALSAAWSLLFIAGVYGAG
jgi:decaprenyl-phosphate phosphoribosyltransferase